MAEAAATTAEAAAQEAADRAFEARVAASAAEAAREMDARGRITTRDIGVAVAALRSGRCTYLNGFEAKWYDAEAGRLADALEAGGGARLEGLYLYGNNISNDGAGRLAAVVESGACPELRKIDLRGYGNVSRAVRARIAEACKPENRAAAAYRRRPRKPVKSATKIPGRARRRRKQGGGGATTTLDELQKAGTHFVATQLQAASE